MAKTKQEKLATILRLIEEHDVSANSIAVGVNMGPYGVLKIVKKETKNPQKRTVDLIYKYMIDNYGNKSKDVTLSDYDCGTIMTHIVKNLEAFEKDPTYVLFEQIILKNRKEKDISSKVDEIIDYVNDKAGGNIRHLSEE